MAQVVYQKRDFKNQIRSIAVLAGFAVHGEPHGIATDVFAEATKVYLPQFCAPPVLLLPAILQNAVCFC